MKHTPVRHLELPIVRDAPSDGAFEWSGHGVPVRCISKALLILLIPALLLGGVLFFPEGTDCDVHGVLLRPGSHA